MSVENHQTSIDDSVRHAMRQLRRKAILEEGGVYGRRQTRTPDLEDEGICRNCERKLPSEVARVVGDNHGCVPGCKKCAKSTDGKRYNSTRVVAQMIRKGNRVRLDD